MTVLDYRRSVPKGGMQDAVRQALLSYGEREISLSVNDLVNKTGYTYSQVYQTLYRLQNLGELTIINENDDPTSRSPIRGVILNKMEAPEKIEERIEDRNGAITVDKETMKMQATLTKAVPNILAYLNQRLAIERAAEELKKASIEPSEVIRFEPNPIGEEALYVLEELTKTKRAFLLQSNDLEAAIRDRDIYKSKVAESNSRTYDDSGT